MKSVTYELSRQKRFLNIIRRVVVAVLPADISDTLATLAIREQRSVLKAK